MEQQDLDRRVLLGVAGIAGVAALAKLSHAGPLSPPSGPITSTPGPEPRIEINSVNTPGDSTSVFKITTPGNYVLKQDVIGSSGKHGILIGPLVPGLVTIDLNGYALRGGSGSLNGIEISNSLTSTVRISSGVILNWGGTGINGGPLTGPILSIIAILIGLCVGDGIRLAPTTNAGPTFFELEDILISSCRDGISIGGTRNGTSDNIMLSNCRSIGNSRHGILCDATLTNARYMWDPSCLCSNNGGDGIRFAPSASGGSITCIKRSVISSGNTGAGVALLPTLSATACQLKLNDTDVANCSGGGLNIGGNWQNSTVDIAVSDCSFSFGPSPSSFVFHQITNSLVSYTSSRCRSIGNAQGGLKFAPTGTGVMVITVSHEVIQNNTGGPGASVIMPPGISGSLSFNECSFENNSGGGALINATIDVQARGCTFQNNTGNGLTVAPNAKECTVSECQFSSNSGHGFRFDAVQVRQGPAGCFRVERSTFRRSGLAGISIASCRGGGSCRASPPALRSASPSKAGHKACTSRAARPTTILSSATRLRATATSSSAIPPGSTGHWAAITSMSPAATSSAHSSTPTTSSATTTRTSTTRTERAFCHQFRNALEHPATTMRAADHVPCPRS
ncbi:MAG: right-handed parallel beta-helix repeat-containing protein [Phycisphaerales bacterium]|nr:right-handed parallel beta-helix repeat-containing protein [Phycisphaerales bacterium]